MRLAAVPLEGTDGPFLITFNVARVINSHSSLGLPSWLDGLFFFENVGDSVPKEFVGCAGCWVNVTMDSVF